MSPDDRRRLDLVVHGATERGEALCCDATLVSPLRSDGRPHACAADRDGVALSTAERRKRTRYPELGQPAQRLVVLAAEVGGRWHAAAAALVRQLARVRARRAPPAVRLWPLRCSARFAAPSSAAGCRGLCLLEGTGRCSGMSSAWQSPAPSATSPSARDGACRGPPSACEGVSAGRSARRFAQPFHCSSHPPRRTEKKIALVRPGASRPGVCGSCRFRNPCGRKAPGTQCPFVGIRYGLAQETYAEHH